jgi:2-aminoadipate transaminase
MSTISPTFSATGQRATSPTIARLMTMALEKPGLLSLSAGFTDNLSLPVDAVREATLSLLSRPSEPEYLQYGTNQGRPLLREELARRLLATDPGAGELSDLASRCLVTNGSQQALYLAVQVLCDAGDLLLVDRPSYFVFLEMLAGLGIRAVSIPTDASGATDLPALGRLLASLKASGEARRLKGVYFVSYFSNPSSRSLPESEKGGIARTLRSAGLVVPVIEDAAYRELYYTRPHPVRSVLDLPDFDGFPRLYLATLTKTFATGLKIGYGFCSDRAWLGKMLAVKGHHDFGSCHFAQALCELVIGNGAFDSQLRRVRDLYQAKMLALHRTLLREGLRELGWTWEEPTGGLYLWLRGPADLDTSMDSAFCKACLDAGVIYVPGDLCFGEDAPKNQVRLSFGVLPLKDLEEAGRRFVKVARQAKA